MSKSLRRSGLEAAHVAHAAASYDAITLARGAAWWLESLPAEGGRTALMGAPIPYGNIAEATPPGVNVGSSIHAYGGGTYAIDDTRAGTSTAVTVRSTRSMPEAPNHVTPCAGFEDITAYGDLTLQGGQLIAVGETADGDRLVQFAEPDTGPRTLARTGGFFAALRQHGDRLAWLSWEPDRMPWDATRLRVADLRRGELSNALVVAEGDTESVWSRNGAPATG